MRCLQRGSAAAIAAALRDTEKAVRLYDSFCEPPPTTERDSEEADEWVGRCVGGIAKVKEVFGRAAFPFERVAVRKGCLHETFTEPTPDAIAILHIDPDLYNSVRLCLETPYGLVSKGGIVILDDFGAWEGCREAFYDSCAVRNLKPLLERTGQTHAFCVKNRTHNRRGPAIL